MTSINRALGVIATMLAVLVATVSATRSTTPSCTIAPAAVSETQRSSVDSSQMPLEGIMKDMVDVIDPWTPAKLPVSAGDNSASRKGQLI